jgi:hypothetical protein
LRIASPLIKNVDTSTIGDENNDPGEVSIGSISCKA